MKTEDANSVTLICERCGSYTDCIIAHARGLCVKCPFYGELKLEMEKRKKDRNLRR